MSMYVRIKRKNQTIFLHVESTDSFGQLKKQVGEILEMDPNNVQFIGPDKTRELPEMATIADQDIANESILYMVFRKGASDGWEEIDVGTADGGSSKKG